MSSFVDKEADPNKEEADPNKEEADPDKEEANPDKEEADEEEEPLHFLSLSNDGIGSIIVVLKFLTIYDISKLDIAYCNHKLRIELLKTLSDNPLITYDIKFRERFEQFDCVLKWIGLRKINISELRMDGNKNTLLTDAGLIGLARHCSSLRSLDVGACNGMLEFEGVDRITDEGIIELARQTTSLTSLDISFRSCSDAGLFEIAKHCSSLQDLDISSCRMITDTGVIEIAKQCASLKKLDICSCRITDAALIGISQHCTSLHSLLLVQCMRITDTGVIEVAKHCTDLISLNARFCNITDKSLSAIAKHCKNLKTLMFGECTKITNAGRSEIRRCLPNLEDLDDEVSISPPDRVYPHYYLSEDGDY